MKLGLDIGNKNLKICSDKDKPHEFPVAYREITSDEYINEAVGGEQTDKVKYLNKHYLVGLQCQNGLPRNKGDIKHREIANMFKLIGLAKDLELNNKAEGCFKVVTGTPVADYEEFKDDYFDLMISKGSEFEIIEVNHKEYKIKVEDAYIVKQSACLAPTIPNWKQSDLLIVDFGGGTLDIAHFKKGVKQEYLTIDFSLNNQLAELGRQLNVYKLGLPRANTLDSGFISLMEEVILNGRYQNETTITINGIAKDLKTYCAEWLQQKIDVLIDDVIIKLNLSASDCKATAIYYIGGGVKLLRNQLRRNDSFENIIVMENPQYANVMAYLIAATVRREWK